MAKIFISYRRADTQMAAGRVHDRLITKYGRDNVFKDVDSIPAGQDFRRVLSDWVEKTDVMLVLIGTQWLTLRDAEGNRRLDNADDFVRFEVNLGLRLSGVTVIPVIVGTASPPTSDQLPEALRELAYLNAVFVRNDPDFHRDMNRLINSLDGYLHGDLESSEIKAASLAEKSQQPRNQGVNPALIGVGVLTLVAILIGIVWFMMDLAPENNFTQPEPTQIAANPADGIDPDDARATGAAQAFATLTALAPTDTPTITPTPSNTPISSSDIQRTGQAEIFATETIIAGTQAIIAQETQNAILTEQFSAGATATHIVQLSLTPPLTPTPDLPEAEQLALTGVTSNAEWENLVGEGGYVREFDGVEMMLVPAGCFVMGNDPDSFRGEPDGKEQCFNEPFWVDKTEVTQSDFERLGGEQAAPPDFDGANRPVEDITWFEARDFCAARDGRLPTEAEWGYVARGPDELYFPWGNDWNADNAVWNRSSSQGTADVGSILAGASWVGALDMSGNVWEWTRSVYEDYPYMASDGREADLGSETDVLYTLRGGSWDVSINGNLRSATRSRSNPNINWDFLGFRCVLSYE